jgi:hypothetical protein
VYADFMRIILEVVNCILTSNLAANPQLVCFLLAMQSRQPTATCSNDV